ncbi:hypothetical protein PC119_g11325 [Phytophthora cactorum]|uniref:Uncharacterized protein n=1 Tax=Phytophthora cactorum TaxID=29920 RepID=A0A8T1DFF0_9STRA|nr:hypothetical protein PC117_g10930 [Phytophthora cactorum]KAG3016554.1 hypothetical protein PC119_g11325 [Phytophthora cactorum]
MAASDSAIPAVAASLEASVIPTSSASNSKRRSLSHRYSSSEKEAYEPDDEDVADDEEKRDMACGQPLRFDFVDTLGPNVKGGAEGNALEADGEGEEDSADCQSEYDIDTDMEPIDETSTSDDNLQQELTGVKKLMNAAELERLHLRVQGKK